MKNTITILFTLLLCTCVFAQIKIIPGGVVYMNSTANVYSFATVGKLGGVGNPQQVVGSKFNIFATNQCPLGIENTNTVIDNGMFWPWAEYSTSDLWSTKHWITTQKSGSHNFFVLSNGTMYYKNAIKMGSDSNLKFDIHALGPAMSSLMALNPVRYRMRPYALCQNCLIDSNTPDSFVAQQTRMGFLAQEVEQILPSLVDTMDDGKKALSIIEFIPLLVKGFQEQQAQIEALTAQLTECCSQGIGSGNSGGGNIGLSTPVPPDPQGSRDGRAIKPILYQNTPNPFNEETSIKYYVPESSQLSSIYVYDMRGVQLKKYPLAVKGEGSITITSRELKAAMYMYTLIVDGKEIDTKKMILTR